MFYQILLSPQVKRCAIITYKHGIYELFHMLPNKLRLRKIEHIKKLSKLHAQSSSQDKNFVNTSKKLLKNGNYTLPVKRYFT